MAAITEAAQAPQAEAITEVARRLREARRQAVTTEAVPRQAQAVALAAATAAEVAVLAQVQAATVPVEAIAQAEEVAVAAVAEEDKFRPTNKL